MILYKKGGNTIRDKSGKEYSSQPLKKADKSGREEIDREMHEADVYMNELVQTDINKNADAAGITARYNKAKQASDSLQRVRATEKFNYR